MSKLAQKIKATDAPPRKRQRPGPANVCRPLYGLQDDLEDWTAMEEWRLTVNPDHTRRTWNDVQRYIDGLEGIENPLPLDKFKHHWRRICTCWPDEFRVGRG